MESSDTLNDDSAVQSQNIFSIHLLTTNDATEKLPLDAAEFVLSFTFENQAFVEAENFTLQSKLGSGSYGAVYKVKSSVTDKTFALKRVKKNILNIPEIYREKDSLVACNSDYIIRLYACFQTENHVNFLLEEAKFGSLFEVLNTGQYCDIIKASFLLDVGLGLSYLHSENIIHRDLKPENILVDNTFHCKIGDLGSSIRCRNGQEFFSDFGSTLSYQSPASIRSQIYNKASDLWSYGATIFEIYIVPHSIMFENTESILDEKFVLKRIREINNPQIEAILKSLMQPTEGNRPCVDDIIRQHNYIWEDLGEQVQNLPSVNLQIQTPILRGFSEQPHTSPEIPVSLHKNTAILQNLMSVDLMPLVENPFQNNISYTAVSRKEELSLIKNMPLMDENYSAYFPCTYMHMSQDTLTATPGICPIMNEDVIFPSEGTGHGISPTGTSTTDLERQVSALTNQLDATVKENELLVLQIEQIKIENAALSAEATSLLHANETKSRQIQENEKVINDFRQEFASHSKKNRSRSSKTKLPLPAEILTDTSTSISEQERKSPNSKIHLEMSNSKTMRNNNTRTPIKVVVNSTSQSTHVAILPTTEKNTNNSRTETHTQKNKSTVSSKSPRVKKTPVISVKKITIEKQTLDRTNLKRTKGNAIYTKTTQPIKFKKFQLAIQDTKGGFNEMCLEDCAGITIKCLPDDQVAATCSNTVKASSSNSIKSDHPNSNTIMPCPECGKKYTRNDNRKRHRLKAHSILECTYNKRRTKRTKNTSNIMN